SRRPHTAPKARGRLVRLHLSFHKGPKRARSFPLIQVRSNPWCRSMDRQDQYVYSAQEDRGHGLRQRQQSARELCSSERRLLHYVKDGSLSVRLLATTPRQLPRGRPVSSGWQSTPAAFLQFQGRNLPGPWRYGRAAPAVFSATSC